MRTGRPCRYVHRDLSISIFINVTAWASAMLHISLIINRPVPGPLPKRTLRGNQAFFLKPGGCRVWAKVAIFKGQAASTPYTSSLPWGSSPTPIEEHWKSVRVRVPQGTDVSQPSNQLVVPEAQLKTSISVVACHLSESFSTYNVRQKHHPVKPGAVAT